MDNEKEFQEHLAIWRKLREQKYILKRKIMEIDRLINFQIEKLDELKPGWLGEEFKKLNK